MVVNDTDSLKGLVETAIERHHTSARQLAFKAQDAGFKITYTTLNQIRSNTYKFTPGEATIKAIAYLAGVEESVAFAAAGQPVPGPPLADELPPGADNLSPKSRKAVVEMVRVLVDLETNNNDTQTIRETGREQARGKFEQAKQERRAVRASWTADDPDGSKQKTLDLIRKASEAREEADPENFSVVELHGDEARNIPVPPREQLAAHPKVKTKREQLDEETDSDDQREGGE
ncbi:hypothetical protein [Glutamicibacter nicotianae]|uniref:hypothetical protein n=1 Tax=Glutamicibacter nicotianae TaxID=37929 RepID=UPI00167FCA64|nr:hypothetical protein [Glutamicibacter nicotianae]